MIYVKDNKLLVTPGGDLASSCFFGDTLRLIVSNVVECPPPDDLWPQNINATWDLPKTGEVGDHIEYELILSGSWRLWADIYKPTPSVRVAIMIEPYGLTGYAFDSSLTAWSTGSVDNDFVVGDCGSNYLGDEGPIIGYDGQAAWSFV